ERAYTTLDGGFDQGAGVAGIVLIVAQWIADPPWNKDGYRQVDNCFDIVTFDQGGNQSLVSDIANHQLCCCRQRRSNASRQVVDHEDVLAGVNEFMNSMTANISSSASDQYTHDF